MGHELALERPLEDGLPVPVGPLQVGRDGGFAFIDETRAARAGGELWKAISSG
jgi:hypothetical protein